MTPFKATISSRYILNMICVAICLIPLCLTYWTSGRASNNLQTSFKVINRASNLTVVGTTEPKDGDFELTVRNDYDEVVTAYAYSFDPANVYNSTNDAMRPGDTSTSVVALPEKPTSDEGLVLTILAVAFQNNMGDGDLRIVRELVHTQLGQAAQIERVNELIREFSRGISHDIPGRLAKLKSDIVNLPDPPEAETSFSFRSAVHDEKRGALEKVEELESAYRDKGLDGFRLRLNKIQAGFEQRNSFYKSGLTRQTSK